MSAEKEEISNDQPIGSPKRSFEIEDPEQPNQSKKPVKTWATMPIWKKALVIFFLIVCGFGLYDTFFPSEKSLRIEELMPKFASPTLAQSYPIPSISPTPSPAKDRDY